eukprot:CAMPEP_0203771540 /NCGR_PEP_ID=MMETSP0099_2-20121227/3468_1 /ASSEMBLY_ACC=CAM_ASM_000209 /TAXON_ID=96639 /ORGANISM=" , Strain NY0313808BC1" /LENGTH=331 /DNA_ID=CAMNT_0050668889 /DNA_START=53 /DNA_END=1048 /DNA_ORIENTATION=-
MTPESLQRQVTTSLVWIMYYNVIVLGISVALDVTNIALEIVDAIWRFKLPKLLPQIGKLVVCLVVCFIVTMTCLMSFIPLASLNRPTIQKLVPGPIINAYSHTSNSIGSVTNGYGLFRRMTGVGENGEVARPEVVFEIKDADTQLWRELDFMHKPGNLSTPPEFIIPFQPRLDWQMWFAALGNYQNNPWLVNFANKVLDNSPDVLRLIGKDPSEKPPSNIRAFLYKYDFTARDSDPTNWWVRHSKQEYLPTIARNDKSVETFLKAHKLLVEPPANEAQEGIKNSHEAMRIIKRCVGKIRFYGEEFVRTLVSTQVVVAVGLIAVLGVILPNP